ncbi:MAG: 2-hydroxychromene-2-carboxylate isomerase [Comamonadaceae bacterium]|nr:2-hydroxychromene-2-carboxylate isomerase [Burkholderiales bacterium]MEB2349354.1 2-hydroxychromene-2-carboxylate isomerase [Comamonadaceae bacterium]
MKIIHYYLAPRSPWTYLGHARLLALAQKHGAEVEPRPFAMGDVIFPMSGGLQLKDRPPQRQAYRLVELQRWSTYLGIPLHLHPRYFPVDETSAARMIAATIVQHGNAAALRLTGAVLRAVWAEERDISDPQTLTRIGTECGLDGPALYDARMAPAAVALYDRNTQAAIDLQVFGAPWYEFEGESFWGQDRLEFLDRALAARA